MVWGMRVRWGRPFRRFAPPPLAQGRLETGDADCHSQFENWPRNDRLQEVQGKLGGGPSGRPAPTDGYKEYGGYRTAG